MDPNAEDQTIHPEEAGTSSAGQNGVSDSNGQVWQLAPEDIPNIDRLVIEDGKPVDNIFVEKLQRLLTEPLYSCWPGPGEGRRFMALSNVGLFFALSQPPLVPDVLLSLDAAVATDLSRQENRSYFIWVVGKAPEVVIEIVSDRRGGEASHKMRDYARIGIPYYVIFDPYEHLGSVVLRGFALHARTYGAAEVNWFPEVGLGLTLWQGTYEGIEGRWLRWCDKQGRVVPTGHERAEQERQRIERLEAQLRALGQKPTA